MMEDVLDPLRHPAHDLGREILDDLTQHGLGDDDLADHVDDAVDLVELHPDGGGGGRRDRSAGLLGGLRGRDDRDARRPGLSGDRRRIGHGSRSQLGRQLGYQRGRARELDGERMQRHVGARAARSRLAASPV